MTRRLLACGAALLLAGCGAAKEAMPEEAPAATSRRPADEAPPDRERPLAGGPWQERPKTTQTSGRPASRVRLGPLGAATAAAPPELPAAVCLAVVWLDLDRRLVHDGRALLDLEAALSGDAAVQEVLALDPGPEEGSWALADLCAAAAKQGVDLVLVDAAASDGAEAALVAVARRVVLRTERRTLGGPEGGLVHDPGPGDLADRVLLAWRRSRPR